MNCKICGKNTDKTLICKDCSYYLKNGADKDTIRRMNSDDKTNKIWNENKKTAEDLADAYYDNLIEDYKDKLKKDSKENFGYNAFADGIKMGLDITIPLVGEEAQNKIKEKIRNMIETRKKVNQNIKG